MISFVFGGLNFCLVTPSERSYFRVFDLPSRSKVESSDQFPGMILLSATCAKIATMGFRTRIIQWLEVEQDHETTTKGTERGKFALFAQDISVSNFIWTKFY